MQQPRKRIRVNCHWCGKKTTKYADEVIVQAFTGRRFCSSGCWENHQTSEGF